MPGEAGAFRRSRKAPTGLRHGPERVCAGCFVDPSLQARVRANLSGRKGTCHHCGTFGERTAPADVVADVLTAWVDGWYTTELEPWDECGASLIELLREDEIFHEDVFERGRAEDLLAEVITSVAVVRASKHDLDKPSLDDGWTRAEVPRARDAGGWDLRHLGDLVARYGHALDHILDTRTEWDLRGGAVSRNRLAGDLDRLAGTIPARTALYRARIGHDEAKERGWYLAPWTGKDIGAPPPERSRSDRVAVAGQRVLFLAESRDTAVAEVRPAKGDLVSTAEFVLPKDVRVVDFRPRPDPTGDLVERVEQLRRQTLADVVGGAYARPVGSDGTRHYLLTQYVARLIERKGYDGIVYPSAQREEGANGYNVVLFDPERAGEPGAPAHTRVEGVSYQLGAHLPYRGQDEEPDL